MIYVEVSGTKKIKLLTEACYFYLSRLNIYKKTIPLDIYIHVCRMVISGHCAFNHDFKEPEITISLNNKLSEEELLITLAHELVHARQFIRKQQTNEGRIHYWKGVATDNEEWEVEAYELEQNLYSDYLTWK